MLDKSKVFFVDFVQNKSANTIKFVKISIATRVVQNVILKHVWNVINHFHKKQKS